MIHLTLTKLKCSANADSTPAPSRHTAFPLLPHAAKPRLGSRPPLAATARSYSLWLAAMVLLISPSHRPSKSPSAKAVSLRASTISAPAPPAKTAPAASSSTACASLRLWKAMPCSSDWCLPTDCCRSENVPASCATTKTTNKWRQRQKIAAEAKVHGDVFLQNLVNPTHRAGGGTARAALHER